jgi:hypothetical protein
MVRRDICAEKMREGGAGEAKLLPARGRRHQSPALRRSERMYKDAVANYQARTSLLLLTDCRDPSAPRRKKRGTAVGMKTSEEAGAELVGGIFF